MDLSRDAKNGHCKTVRSVGLSVGLPNQKGISYKKEETRYIASLSFFIDVHHCFCGCLDLSYGTDKRTQCGGSRAKTIRGGL